MLIRIVLWLAGRAWNLPGRRRLLLFLVPPATATAALTAVLAYPAPPAAGGAAPPPAVAADAEAAQPAALPPPAGLLVDVTGAVVRPGLYRITRGERVSAAIAAAGGLAADADPARLPNMAALVRDGQQVRVPSLGTSARSAGTGAGAGTPRLVTVSLNAATAEELAAVPGFTPDLAAAAIRYRTEFGGFATTRELVDVLDMSEADYLLAKRYVRV